MSPADAAAAARLELALEMFDDGVAIMRENLVRTHPAWSSDQIDAALDAWLAHRPGAEHGDGVGEPGTWPRSK
jgi:hypothetical protein